MKRALFMSSGVLVWALHFAAVYGFTGLACARGWERSVEPAVAGITIVGAVGAAGLLVLALRRRGDFEHGIAAGLAAFALLAILWEGASVAFIVPCASR